MRKNHTNLILIFSIICTLLCVGAFAFFFRVIRNKNQHSSNVLATLQSKISEKDNANLLDKKIAGMKIVADTIGGHFVDPATINKFVDYLEAFGTSTKTELLVKDVQVLSDNANTIAVKVSIRGSFTDVVQTIALLENNAYVIHITSVYLNKDIPIEVPTVPGKSPPAPAPTLWQADVSFTVLNS